MFFLEIIFFKKVKDGAYAVNLDKYGDIRTHCIALFCRRNEIAYFDSFCVEHVPEETKKYRFVFILKLYPENFTFLILRILEYLTVKLVNFLKSRLICISFY